jgi:uracil-DNA glycosylase family 4
MSCTKCNLHRTCRKVQIPGRGSNNPTIMFVGQAPGAMEDEIGQCFVGPVGQLLQQAIKEYGLVPAYLTNLVKCFPPNDRDPKKEEIEACKPYLMEEIARLKPEIIVLLGSVPLQAMMKIKGITNYSGTVVNSNSKTKVFALFHPSFILRYPRMQPKFEMHLRSLSDLLHKRPREEALAAKLISCEEAKSILNMQQSMVAFDFETSGQFKQFGGYIRTCGFATKTDQFAVLANDPKFKEFMRWFLLSDHVKCAFNLVFETRWCLDEFGVEPHNLYYDPYLMHHLLNENLAHDLESVASHYLGSNGWDISAIMATHGWNYETVPIDVLIPYNLKDCRTTYDLASTLQNLIVAENMVGTYDILVRFAALCARMEHRGIYIDKDWAHRTSGEYKVLCEELRNKMIKMQELPVDFNPNSTKQLSDVLFNTLGITVKTKTNSGANSTKDSVLAPFRQKHEFVATYLDWKHAFTLRNNFCEKFPKFCDTDSIIHPNFNPGKVVTGRASVTEPPAQAIPEEKEVRGMVMSRWDGGRILSSDYDALELRLLASEADEPHLISTFKNGESPHDIMAREMFGAGFTKHQRSIAKRINFGIAYGVTEYTLSAEFSMSVQEALGYMRRHKKMFPKIYQWMDAQHDFVKKNGYITSRFGVMRRLPEVLEGNLPDWKLHSILRQAGNFPIQNAGAYITNLAAILTDDWLRSCKYSSILFHVIHDSCMIDVVPAETEGVLALNKNVMEDQIQSFCKWLKVPLTISQSLNSRWENED